MALRAATSVALAAATFTQLVPPRAGDAPLAARLVPFVVAVVADASQVSGVVAAVCRLLPLPPGLGHLKRVRRSGDGAPAVPPPPAGAMLVLLGPGTQPGALRAAAPRADEALAALAATPGFAGYAAVAAPGAPARDRAVFTAESRCVWPMGWVQPAAAQLAAVPAAPLGEGERAYFAAALGVALQAARDAGGSGDGPAADVRACVITLPLGRDRPDGVRTSGKTVVAAAAADGGSSAITAFRGGLVASSTSAPPSTAASLGDAAVGNNVHGDSAAAAAADDDEGDGSAPPLAPHEFIVRAVTIEVTGATAALPVALPSGTTCVFEALRRIGDADKRAAGTAGSGSSAAAAADDVGTSAFLADELQRVPSVAAAASSAPSASRKRSRPDDTGSAADAPPAPAPSDTQEPATQPLAPSPVFRPAVRGGYVCTGHDAFLTHEPGPAEAMALLHARVARVVFLAPDPHHGALGGAGPLRLHELRSLNHHYLAYRATLGGISGGVVPVIEAPTAATALSACVT